MSLQLYFKCIRQQDGKRQTWSLQIHGSDKSAKNILVLTAKLLNHVSAELKSDWVSFWDSHLLKSKQALNIMVRDLKTAIIWIIPTAWSFRTAECPKSTMVGHVTIIYRKCQPDNMSMWAVFRINNNNKKGDMSGILLDSRHSECSCFECMCMFAAAVFYWT